MINQPEKGGHAYLTQPPSGRAVRGRGALLGGPGAWKDTAGVGEKKKLPLSWTVERKNLPEFGED